MKEIFFKITFLLTVFMLSSCSSDNEPKVDDDDDLKVTTEISNGISLSRSEQEIANGQTELALAFFRKYNEAKQNDNFVCSPFSLSNVLAMLSNGVSAEAVEEICSLYGLSNADLASINSLHSKLLKELPIIDSKSNFTSANMVTVMPNLSFNEQFKSAVQTYFGAEAVNLDLSTSAGVAQFNNWCSKKTNGMIPKMLDGPVSSIFSISSADYFKAKWRVPFDEKSTVLKIFNNANGNCKRVPTMYNKLRMDILPGDDISVAQLYYGNMAFRFSIILPGSFMENTGKTVSEVASSLTIEKWNEINAKTYEEDCMIYLPKFAVNNRNDITPLVDAMGLKSMFKDGGLSGIVANNPNLGGLMILQGVNIEVTENGTKAASVTTAIGVGSNWTPSEPINIDRPFIFIIDETSTGAILYAGVIRNL